jgi:5-methylcytosine-specific restriction endonuclease McrA
MTLDEVVENFSFTKSRKIKKFVREYSLRLGLKDVDERYTTKQHVLRISNNFPHIARYVRPKGGKVTPRQCGLLFRYMVENPIGDFVVPGDYFKKKERAQRPVYKVVRSLISSEKRDEFYRSWDWKQARYTALKTHGPVCQCCGAKRGDLDSIGEPVRIDVDHIKPISQFWKLRLDQSNLQILCRDCNMGKGSWDQTNWRSVA